MKTSPKNITQKSFAVIPSLSRRIMRLEYPKIKLVRVVSE